VDVLLARKGIEVELWVAIHCAPTFVLLPAATPASAMLAWL
jgi:hypothetical protein